MRNLSHNDTIIAIATASGMGAIGLVRLSGPQALSIADTLFAGKRLDQQNTHTAHFGRFYQSERQQNEPKLIDEVVVTLFLGSKSFTGEDTVEIAAHGSPYILDQILQACIAEGARLAE